MSIDLNNPQVREKLLEWCRGEQSAAAFLDSVARFARIADDIVDGDRQDVQMALVELLSLTLVVIPNNPFYKQYSAAFIGTINEMLLMWKVSDDFKASGDAKKQTFGYCLREATDRIAVVTATIMGGVYNGEKAYKELFEMTHAQSTETVEEWAKET